MNRRIPSWLAFGLIGFFAVSMPLLAIEKVILDTDPSYDPDDVGCMAMLHGMANAGELEILAVMNVFTHEESALAISAINEFYGRGGIPIGDYRAEPKTPAPETNYDHFLANNYPRRLQRSSDAPEVTDLYREILAGAESNSVTILVIGTMNNIELLLKSGPDRHSKLNGIDLIAKSVKQVVTMGGNFIDGRGYDRTNWGGSNELCRDDRTWACLNPARNAMVRYVLENCPVPFVASGWENGNGQFNNAEQGDVRSGSRLKEFDANHITRVAYEKHFESRGGSHKIDRHSNDQCALLYGARGAGDYYTAHLGGKIILTPEGECIWEDTPNGLQGYVAKLAPDQELATLIEDLMMAEAMQPDTSAPTPPGKVRWSNEGNKVRLTWTAAQDRSPGSWVAYYQVYRDGQPIARAHRTEITLPASDTPYTIAAVNVSGTESKPVLAE
ncbi:nucleoside hydrolase [Opitutaceae bacterium]|nr:nucleoside hydrolase [Opitutaceae bacterium]